MTPVTRNVVLDTEVVSRARYDFTGGVLGRLAALGAERWANILITFITLGEIEAQIRDHAAGFVSGLARLMRDHPALRHDERLANIVATLEPASVESAALAAFQRFLREADVEVIPISDVTPEHVFTQYFKAQPPFSEGRKRHEFPDAFSLAAIREWCRQHAEKVYVVSGDDDWKRACENDEDLIYLADIRPFIDEISKSSVRTAVWRDAQVAFTHLQSEIKEQVVEQVTDADYEVYDLVGSVKAAAVSDIYLSEPYVLDFAEDGVVFVTEARMALVLDMEYLDDSGSDVEESVPETWRVPVMVKIKVRPNADPLLREVDVDLSVISSERTPEY